MKLPSRYQITILILFVCLVCLYQFFLKPLGHSLNNVATGKDAEQASSLWHFVVGKVSFDDKSMLYADAPPVYANPSRKSVRLEIFGAANSEKQEQVLSAAKVWQSTNEQTDKIRVLFYEKEKPRGKYGQNVEKLLREEFIVLSSK